MKIRELRRFLEDFIVYVNTKEDIETLRKDKRFKLHASYRDRLGKLQGIEFRFKYAGTLGAAKKFIKEVLNGTSGTETSSKC